jgi:hypothetical protein
MQLFGLIIVLCLAMIYILAFWVRRMPSSYAENFARPISGRDRRSMPARFDAICSVLTYQRCYTLGPRCQVWSRGAVLPVELDQGGCQHAHRDRYCRKILT